MPKAPIAKLIATKSLKQQRIIKGAAPVKVHKTTRAFLLILSEIIPMGIWNMAKAMK
jgi:hypothetical protein